MTTEIFLGIADFFQVHTQIYQLNRLSSSEIVNSYGDQIRKGLGRRTDAVITLVCAKNEEQDLARLFFALAQSVTPTQVVVVDNNSTDQTAALATSLGATVVSEKQPGLCNALAGGFEYIGGMGQNRFLLTDADAFPVRDWASEMQKGLTLHTGSDGGEIFGPVFYYGEKVKDTFRSAVALALDLRAQSRKIARAHGPNAAIALDFQGRIIEALTSKLRPEDDPELRFKRDCISDQAVRNIVTQVGGNLAFHLHPGTVVFTRGDRYPSIVSILRAGLSQRYKKEVIYGTWKQH